MTINMFQRRKNQQKLEEMTATPLEVTMPRQVAWQTRQQLLLEAKEFLAMFHQECGLHQYYLERSAQVQDEIERTGTYWHTYEELAFGARVAWRNSSRCIGRLYWRTLQVVDRRHLSTEEEIFKALVEHIQLATNGGRIQSMMTIFRPSLPGQASVRIWNPQLIRYAGYRQQDGSVVGDPLHVELSEVIRQLGWQGGGGPFDILPLVIQLSRRLPRLFELPREHVLEVPLSHPDYPWFAELGLKWHALPVLSSMRLEIGGISYTAAPFNGWYMGTEIGARNLGDVQRYNLLPLIARRMGLDTHSDRALWRDRAIVELNIAVLSSFARHRVSIVDHHTASRQFVLHQKREEEAGHVVPADWGWIVPPISGSTTPVFHTPYTDMTLKPNFFAQKEPWRDHES
jgi:nitric-oxide synthase, bacterial